MERAAAPGTSRQHEEHWRCPDGEALAVHVLPPSRFLLYTECAHLLKRGEKVS